MPKVIDVEGIGPKHARTLQGLGVRTTTMLLKVAASKKGRQDLAAETGIPEKLILEWVNLADLMRIKGIGEEYSDLLEEAGVDSAKELRNRNPRNLYQALRSTNAAKKLVRRLPGPRQVENWVKQAKSLKPVVTH